MLRKYGIIALTLALLIFGTSINVFGLVELPAEYPFHYTAKVNFNSKIEYQTIQGIGGFGFRDYN
ncbi:MAG TPA: hypothetical protein VF941_04740, partial [Clostridia bacterium]